MFGWRIAEAHLLLLLLQARLLLRLRLRLLLLLLLLWLWLLVRPPRLAVLLPSLLLQVGLRVTLLRRRRGASALRPSRPSGLLARLGAASLDLRLRLGEAMRGRQGLGVDITA